MVSNLGSQRCSKDRGDAGGQLFPRPLHCYLFYMLGFKV